MCKSRLAAVKDDCSESCCIVGLKDRLRSESGSVKEARVSDARGHALEKLAVDVQVGYLC